LQLSGKGITNELEFVVIGSQSILARISDPPRSLVYSSEADLYQTVNPKLKELLFDRLKVCRSCLPLKTDRRSRRSSNSIFSFQLFSFSASLPPVHPGYFPVFFWSLLILVSFWGYGELLRRRINRPEFADIGWGLTCAWGMSVVLALGGLLMAFGLAKAANLTVVVLFGVAAAVCYLAGNLTTKDTKSTKGKQGKTKPGPSGFHFPLSAFRFSDLVLYALAALAFASAIAWPLQVDPNDDVVCYLFYPEKILQTGTLIEPFNVRRMGTYGGQALLQALVMIVGAEKNGHVPDRGFGMLMLFGMLLHLSKGIPRSLGLLRFLAVGCLFFVSVPRINTGSSLTGAAMILALLLTLSKLPSPIRAGWTSYLAPALLVSGAGTLRMTYLLCAAGIVTLEPLIRHWTSNRRWLDNLKNAFACVWPIALGAFVLLIPWMAVLWQSNGTPMYPPFSGTMNPEFTILGNKGGPLFDAAHGLALLLTPEVLVLLFCFGLASFARNRPLAYAAVALTVFASWFTAYKFGVAMLSEGYRYTFPMLIPVALWLLISSLRQEDSEDTPPAWQAFLPPTLVLGLLLALNLPSAGRELGIQAESLPQQLVSRDPLVNPALTNAARELQNYTPVGSKLFVAVDTPYAFDFARNEIFTADMPGGSAIGKWPLDQGPTVFEKYLSGLGFKYIIASDFDNAMLLYTRKLWKTNQRPEWFFKEVNGKYFLDFMENVDAIAKTGRVVATAANLRLIEINSK